ncbi:hypothetical protein SC936_04365 [Aggregatibacter actinomycetemcomitans serotype e str. SC936]|nr:hypothetical protein SA3096_09085 [Aggregatibacter actinomycetemcomitans serotype e str. SA3096]KYK81381.1 hypothetical protein SC936_04365 [Aggregatibacter actinomycetemcomitans serotype e str. SC936]TYB22435.1 hypothetical protein FXB85_09835 [Aggregatibacter actinomycetemcomitans]
MKFNKKTACFLLARQAVSVYKNALRKKRCLFFADKLAYLSTPTGCWQANIQKIIFFTTALFIRIFITQQRILYEFT